MSSNNEEHTNMDVLLNSLDLRESGTCDCIIICGQTEYSAHRLILASCSPYLRSIIQRNQSEEVIKIDLSAHIGEEAMIIILNYMHRGKFNYTSAKTDILNEVVSASKFLRMDNLFHTSLELLAEELSTTSIQLLLQLCDKYEADGLVRQIISHLQNKTCHLHLREDFLTLTTPQLKQFLQQLSDCQVIGDELNRAIVVWGNANNGTDLNELMKCNRPNNDCANPLMPEQGTPIPGSTTLGVEEATKKCTGSMQHHSLSQNQSILFFRKVEGYDDMMAYDIEKDQFSEWKTFPVPLNEDVISVSHGSHIYFIGGYTNKVELAISSTIYDYCMNMNVLASTERMWFPVISGSAAVLNEEIYVIGVRGEREKEKSSRRVQCFNIATRKCREVAQTNEKYLKCKMCSFQNHIYVADKSTVHAGKLERYDPSSDQWTVIASRGTEWFNIAFVEMQTIVMGPYADSSLNDYELLQDVWHPKIQFSYGPNGVYGFWSAVKNNKPIILAQCRDNFLYGYDIALAKWERKLHSVTLTQAYTTVIVTKYQQPHHVEQEQQHPALSSLNCMRQHKDFTDVTLICQQHEVHAHSFVLRSALPYFQSMFASGFQESKSRSVNFPNVSLEAMEIILTFLYTGTIHEDDQLDFNLIVDILTVSHLMEITKLYKAGIIQLEGLLTMNNFQEIYRIAELYTNESLTCIVSTFLVDNLIEFLQSGDFVLVSALHLKRILLHPRLEITTEIRKKLLEKLMLWCQHDPEKREQELEELILILKPDQVSEKKYTALNTVKNMMSRMMKPHASENFDPGQVLSCTIISGSSHSQSHDHGALAVICDDNTKKAIENKILVFTVVAGMAAVAFGSHIYFFGGGTEDSDSTRRIYQYCPTNNEVISEDILKAAVTDGGACVLGDNIYVVSGNSVQRYIPAISKCDTVANTNVKHTKPIMFVLKTCIFVFSLCDTQNNNVMEQYNPLTEQWTVVTTLPFSGTINFVKVNRETVYLEVTRRFVKCLDYGYGGCIVRSSELKELLIYLINTDKWSVKESKGHTSTYVKKTSLYARNVQDDVEIALKEMYQRYGAATIQDDTCILFTDRIQSEFPCPFLIRLCHKPCRKNYQVK